MGEFIKIITAYIAKAVSFLGFFEKFLHERLLGLEILTVFFILTIFFVVFIYLLSDRRFAKILRRLNELERNFKAMKETLDQQPSQKKDLKTPAHFQPVPPVPLSTNKELLIEQALNAAKKGTVKKREEVTGVREDAPKDLFEDVSAPVPDTSKNTAPVPPAREIGDLVSGLDDVSNPFYKLDKAEEEQKKQKPVEPDQKETAAQEIKATVGDPAVSWEAKTALKSDLPVPSKGESAEVILGTDDLVVDAGAELDGSISDLEPDPDGESDRTKIDQIDKNIEIGSDEISIPLDEEPHKEISMEGIVEERRESPRLPKNANVEIVYNGFTDFIQESSVNISQGGMFIKTPNLHPVGSRIKLDVKLKDGYKLINGEAEVVRVEEGTLGDNRSKRGVGIRFVALDEESKNLVEKILKEKKP